MFLLIIVNYTNKGTMFYTQTNTFGGKNWFVIEQEVLFCLDDLCHLDKVYAWFLINMCGNNLDKH